MMNANSTINPSITQMARRLASFCHPERFGLEGPRTPENHGKGRPRYVNNRMNPLPLLRHNINNLGMHRSVHRRSKQDVKKHLVGTKALFNIARSDRKVIELAIDIDGAYGSEVSYEEVDAWARQKFAVVFPLVTPFIEPSRSYPKKPGVYVRFRVDWGNVSDPDARHRVESELNKLIQSVFVDAPEEIKNDGIKGTTRYSIENPHYDDQLANTIEWGGKYMLLVQLTVNESEWLYGGDYLQSIGWHEGIDLVSNVALSGEFITACDVQKLKLQYDDCPIASEPSKEWVRHTDLEQYQRSKVFHNLENRPDQPFPHNTALEPLRLVHGTLVTTACFKSLSGDRPNNLDDYLAWSDRNNHQGVITQAVIKKVLGLAQYEQAINPLQRTCNTSTNHKLNVGSNDQTLLEDTTADRFARYLAGVRIACLMTDDMDEMIEMTLQLWESPNGPSEGERHQEREDRARRLVEKWLDDYDAEGFDLPGDQPWFEQQDVDDLQRSLTGVFSNDDLDRAQKARGLRRGGGKLRSIKLSRLLIAQVTTWLCKNIVTGNIREVPTSSIIAGMKHLYGVTLNGSTLKAIIDLLLEKKLITATNPSPNQCRCYTIESSVLNRKWMGTVPIQVLSAKLQSQQNSQPVVNSEALSTGGIQYSHPLSTPERGIVCSIHQSLAELDALIMTSVPRPSDNLTVLSISSVNCKISA